MWKTWTSRPTGRSSSRDAVREFERDAGAVEEGLRHLLQRVQQALRIHPAAEIGDELAQPPVRVGERAVDIAPVLERPRVVAVADRVAQQAHPHAHVGEPLRQRIVHLVRHHLALVGERGAQGLALGSAHARAPPRQRARRHRRPKPPGRAPAAGLSNALSDADPRRNASAAMAGRFPCCGFNGSPQSAATRRVAALAACRAVRPAGDAGKLSALPGQPASDGAPYPNGVSPFPHRW